MQRPPDVASTVQSDHEEQSHCEEQSDHEQRKG